MAFRFRLDEPIEKGFRRVGIEQIERARRDLTASSTDAATGIHETRKCMKRIRALLRLGREGLGETVFAEENARFRTIAASLAPARDDHVLVETFVKLDADAPESLRSTLTDLKSAFIADGNGATTGSHAELIEQACQALDEAQQRFRRLKLTPNDFSVIVRGLSRSYRRGRKGIAAAFAGDENEPYHDWRKSVQAHWRHMALLSRMWPELIEVRIAAARELSQILGDDHDLSILRTRLDTLPKGILAEATQRDVVRLIAKRQQTLRSAARPRGEMIFAASPKAHGEWVASLWAAAVAREAAEKRQEKSRSKRASDPEKPAAKPKSAAPGGKGVADAP